MKKIIAIITLLVSINYLANATTVQQRLNQGEAPKHIFDSGVALDSLYGKTYQGGIIFYLDTIIGNGLISSTSDQSNGIMWGCYNAYIGGTSDTLGSGAANTAAIVAGCNSPSFAAKLCNNLQLNNYSDWYLPSKNELNLMYSVLKLNNYGNFSNMTYWSSTENSTSDAWYISFNNGSPNTGSKSNSSYVRAIRSFDGPAILQLDPSICIVGVDSATNKNRIVWERDANPLIDSVRIYKETVVAGQYTSIGTKAYNQAGIFIDTASNTTVQSYRYKISLIDTNNYESLLSTHHKTMHLTINAGLNNTWNLMWNAYEGFNYNTYNIYRGSDSTNLQLLTQIQSNLNSYSDLNPPTGNVFYQIEIVSPHPCYPDSIYAKANTNYNYSRSNRANSGMAPNIGFVQSRNSKLLMQIFPNPNKGSFILEINSTSNISQNYQLEIYSAMGKLIRQEKISGGANIHKQMNFETLSKGVYFVRLLSDDVVVNGRFVVE